jgi:gas vesicle protein
MSKNGSAFLAFLTGLTVGAVLGVLYAPDEGKNTRDKLSFQLGRYREKLIDLLKKLKDQSDQPVSAAKSEGNRIISDTKTKAEELLNDVELLMGEIKQLSNKG